MPHVPPPLAPLTPATSLDDVVTAIDSVIDWSIENESRLGYFAALYKRITVAVRTAVAHGVFDDGPRMERSMWRSPTATSTRSTADFIRTGFRGRRGRGM